jgi:hypothetical protein
MIQLGLDFTQRWRHRRHRFRPAGELIQPREYDVAPIADDATARGFVVTHHYAASYPAARARYGLYRHGALVGVAVFSHPVNDHTLTSVFPGDARESVELGRFVLLDSVPGNGETWFLARAFAQLRRDGYRGVVSFSDPVARTVADGRVVFPGHVGVIYQASNGCFLGRGTARTLRLLPDATVFSDRAVQKLRKGERGWRYAAALLERHGAETAPEDTTARRAWLATWLPRVTRPLRHPGNFKYAWAFARSDARTLPASAPYPRLQVAA